MKHIFAVMLAFLSAMVLSYAQPKRSVPSAPLKPQKQPTGWYVGLSLGPMNNAVKMDFSDRPFWRYNYVEGWQYPGLEVHRSLGRRVLATFGLNVIQRGQKVETIQKFANISDFTLMRTYLNVPIGIAVDLFDTRISPYVSAGIYGAYWLSGKWTGAVPRILGNPYDENYSPSEPTKLDFEAPYEFSSNDDTGIKENRAEFGVWGGGGLRYQAKSNFRIFVGVTATGGLSSIYSPTKEIKDFQKRKNTGYLLNLGLTFPINKKNVNVKK
ncbi:MAG: hypothetical protein RMJ33_04525 [Saprospiraceae bacterium]|nr:hypothetical protein [Saprospiraceae bacterium]MDW8229083.1 hypothetical protein [Saprospiraceae bacterium]